MDYEDEERTIYLDLLKYHLSGKKFRLHKELEVWDGIMESSTILEIDGGYIWYPCPIIVARRANRAAKLEAGRQRN